LSFALYFLRRFTALWHRNSLKKSKRAAKREDSGGAKRAPHSHDPDARAEHCFVSLLGRCSAYPPPVRVQVETIFDYITSCFWDSSDYFEEERAHTHCTNTLATL
jgi:hypothetical protein